MPTTAVPDANFEGSAISDSSNNITWETFQEEYLSREDAWKYEWIGGTIEKTKRSMNQDQFIILWNLRQLFNRLESEKKISGGLEAEVDTFFLKDVHRRPDIAFFSLDQVIEMAKGNNQIPPFVIEIISSTDAINRVYKKMQDYRDAKVQVVWHIFPKLKEVHIYHGTSMKIYKGTDFCSASPVLPAFEITVEDLFKTP